MIWPVLGGIGYLLVGWFTAAFASWLNQANRDQKLERDVPGRFAYASIILIWPVIVVIAVVAGFKARRKSC